MASTSSNASKEDHINTPPAHALPSDNQSSGWTCYHCGTTGNTHANDHCANCSTHWNTPTMLSQDTTAPTVTTSTDAMDQPTHNPSPTTTCPETIWHCYQCGNTGNPSSAERCLTCQQPWDSQATANAHKRSAEADPPFTTNDDITNATPTTSSHGQSDEPYWRCFHCFRIHNPA